MKRSYAGSLIAATAIGALMTLSAVADADPGTGTPQGCAAQGGYYRNWGNKNGHTYTGCCGVGPGGGCDIYVDGVYPFTTQTNAEPGTAPTPTGPTAPLGPGRVGETGPTPLPAHP